MEKSKILVSRKSFSVPNKHTFLKQKILSANKIHATK